MKPQDAYFLILAVLVTLAFSCEEYHLIRIEAQLYGWQPVMAHQRAETQEILNQTPKGKTHGLKP